MSVYTTINKDLVCKEKEMLSSAGLFSYLAIGLNSQGKDQVYMSDAYLNWLLFGTIKDHKLSKIIRNGTNELIERGYIQLIEKNKNKEYIYDISKIIEKKDGAFIQININEMQKILNINSNVDVVELLRYYVACICTFDSNKNHSYNYKFGDKSQKYLSMMTNINATTINKYNKILEDNRLLYIVRRKFSNYKKRQYGSLHSQCTNIYCKYDDKDLCETYVKQQGFAKTTKQYTNRVDEMRSLSQKYNYFKRTYADKICEDFDKVQGAYNAAKLWNQYAKEDYEAKIENGEFPTLPEYKDLSIFEKYDLTTQNYTDFN